MNKKTIIYGAIVVLAIVHKDFWFWHNNYLLWDFFPIGLAYHAGISICASLLWAAAVFYAWPDDIEEFSEEEVTS